MKVVWWCLPTTGEETEQEAGGRWLLPGWRREDGAPPVEMVSGERFRHW